MSVIIGPYFVQQYAILFLLVTRRKFISNFEKFPVAIRPPEYVLVIVLCGRHLEVVYNINLYTIDFSQIRRDC